MFDCRAMPNPFWDENLRGYTGLDKPVCDFFARFPETVEPFLEATETIVRQSIEQYKRDGRDHLKSLSAAPEASIDQCTSPSVWRSDCRALRTLRLKSHTWQCHTGRQSREDRHEKIRQRRDLSACPHVEGWRFDSRNRKAPCRQAWFSMSWVARFPSLEKCSNRSCCPCWR